MNTIITPSEKFAPHEDDIVQLADGTVIPREMMILPEHSQVIDDIKVIMWINNPAEGKMADHWNQPA